MSPNAERAPGKSANRQQQPNCADTLEPAAAVVNVVVLTEQRLQSMLDAAAAKALEAAPSNDPLPYLDSAAACKMLGVSAPTLRRLVESGQVPSVRLGELRRFDPIAIRKVLAERTGGAP